MELTLESGRVIADATEVDIVASMAGEEFAILASNPNAYIQFAEQGGPPYEYILEYQDGGLDRHYRAMDEPITFDRVVLAFIKYLRKDASWKDDFEWEKLEL